MEGGDTPARAPPPAWLDAAFVEAALRSGGDVDAQVEALEVGHASAPGDNYCSCIFRARARVRGGGGAALLVKALPAGERWARVVRDSRLFAKEGIVLSRVLPAMHALLPAAGPLAARCLRHGDDPAPFVVLEDLRPQGFCMLDRRAGLDLPHALLCVRALARFHGASAALWRRRPELFDGLLSPFDEPGGGSFDDYYLKSFESVADVVSSWTDFPGGYAEKIMLVKDKIVPKIRELNRVRPGKFNVLIHGDFWVNNMLFQYADKKPRAIRFVDFQISHVGNPAIDLIVLHCTSLAEDVFDGQWEHLLGAYSACLAETLQALGEGAPTLADVRRDLEEARAYWSLAAFIWLPVARLDEGMFDLNTAMGDEGYSDSYRSVHKSPSVGRWLRKLLPFLEERGVFDELSSTKS